MDPSVAFPKDLHEITRRIGLIDGGAVEAKSGAFPRAVARRDEDPASAERLDHRPGRISTEVRIDDGGVRWSPEVADESQRSVHARRRPDDLVPQFAERTSRRERD